MSITNKNTTKVQDEPKLHLNYRIVQTIKGESEEWEFTCFSPDNQILAIVLSNYSIMLRDVKTGICKAILSGHSDYVNYLCFSPNGNTIASASNDSSIKIWDVYTGEHIKSIEGHSEGITCISFSPNGKTLASGSEDKTIRIWDIATSKCIQTLTGHNDKVETSCFFPGGRFLASGSADNTIKIWNVFSGECLQTLSEHSDSVEQICISPNGRILASRSSDKTIKLWEFNTSEIKKVIFSNIFHCTITIETDFIPRFINYSLDGEALTIAGFERSHYDYYLRIKLWNISTQTYIKEYIDLDDDGVPTSWDYEDRNLFCLSPDGDVFIRYRSLISAKTFDTKWSTVRNHSNRISSLCYSPDGQILASASYDNRIMLWDASTGIRLVSLYGHDRGYDYQVEVPHTIDDDDWYYEDKKYEYTLIEVPGKVHSICFSPDGSRLASGASDGCIKIWDVSTGCCMKTLRGFDNRDSDSYPSIGIICVSYNVDGQELASLSKIGKVKIWNCLSGECLYTLKASSISCLCYSHDGKILGTASDYSGIQLFNTESYQCILTIEKTGGLNYYSHICFSPDDKMIAISLDTAIKIYDVLTGQCIQILKGHHRKITCFVFMKDGIKLISGSEDNTIKVWDIEGGLCLETLIGHGIGVERELEEYIPYIGERYINGIHPYYVWGMDKPCKGAINCLCLSPDNKTLATAGMDRTILLWKMFAVSEDIINHYNYHLYFSKKDHSDFVNCVSFSPDGIIMASGSRDKTIKIWDVLTGHCLLTLSGHSKGINVVRFSQDGQMLASSSSDCSIRIWDVYSGQCKYTLVKEGVCFNDICFSPDGKLLASKSSDNNIYFWDISNGKLSKTITTTFRGDGTLRFSPDGHTICVGGPHNYHITLYDVLFGLPLNNNEAVYFRYKYFDYNPDGMTLVVVETRNVRILNAYTCECLKSIDLEIDTDAAYYNPNCNILAYAHDKDVYLKDISEKRGLHLVSKPNFKVEFISMSPDGKVIACVLGDNTICLSKVQ